MPEASPPPPTGITTVPGPGRKLLGQLETERSLSRDDPRIVERVNEGGTRLRLDRAGTVDAFVVPLALEQHLRAVPSRRLDLGHRREIGNDDGRGDPGATGRPRDRLAVVPGARRHDPGLALRGRELGDRREGTADLEGTRALQILGLEQHRTPDQPADRLRRE